MTTTPTSGAAIQRYKIGYHADEWGQRSSTPSGIPDASGSWVRYADHVTALAAGQATAAQAVVQDDLITIRKPTTSAEMLWLLKLAHLVISDVDKTLEKTFAPAQPVAEPAGAVSEMVKFTDQSTANPIEKARRYLAHVANKKPNNPYFFDDGYPRESIADDAAAALSVLEQLAASHGQAPAQPEVPADQDDSILLCVSDLQHSAIYDNHVEMQACIRAVVDRIRGLVPSTQPAADAAPTAVARPSDLRTRCEEILAWRKTGVLPGEALRTLAREKYGNEHYAIQLAERDTETEALNVLVSAPIAQPAPQQEAQEPYAYAVYFPDQPKVELVHELDDLIDALTNRPHVVTKLYTAPQPSPAAQGDAIEHELAMLIRRIVSSARRNCQDGSNVLKLANEAWAYLVRKGLEGSPLRDAGIESDVAPQAADSVLEDAARYRLVRRGQHWSVIDGIGNDLRAEALDAAVDAARKQGGAT